RLPGALPAAAGDARGGRAPPGGRRRLARGAAAWQPGAGHVRRPHEPQALRPRSGRATASARGGEERRRGRSAGRWCLSSLGAAAARPPRPARRREHRGRDDRRVRVSAARADPARRARATRAAPGLRRALEERVPGEEGRAARASLRPFAWARRVGRMSELAGRVALVTGASGGIGSATAERLAAAGARVALHYGRNAQAAEELRRRLGGDAIAVGGDLADPAAPAEIVDAVERELGPVDVLVANAGIARRLTWEEADLSAWDEAFAVNLRAPFLLARRVIPPMRERGWGRIVFTSSVAAFIGGIVGPHYAATKSGLHGLVHF